MLNGFILSCQLQQNLAADVEDELTQFGHKKKKTMQCYIRQSAKRIDDENDTYYNNKKQNNH